MRGTWRQLQLKRIAEIRNGATPSSSEPEFWDGDIIWVTPDDLNSIDGKEIADSRRKITITGYQNCGVSMAPANSVVLSTRAPIGHLAIATVPVTINQGCRILTPKDLDTTFLYYALKHQVPYLQALGQGTTFQELSGANLSRIQIDIPPLDEQRAIAAFLDHKTAQIDALIDKKRRMIELLKEKRTALISHAVTKGLNPDAPMKDSGVPWLGQVPAHWEVRALKGLVRRLTDGAHISPDVSSPDFAFVSTVDLKPNGIDFDGCLRTTKESYEYLVRNGCQPNVGDVLFSKDGTVGRTAVIDRNRDFVVASSLVIISPLPQINSWFLERYLNSAGIKQEVALLMSGTALRRISVLKVGRLSTVVPPTVEQKAIVEFLNLEIGKINTIASKTEQAIQKLLEYRIAVISAAVTGQIDVRNHGAA